MDKLGKKLIGLQKETEEKNKTISEIENTLQNAPVRGKNKQTNENSLQFIKERQESN